MKSSSSSLLLLVVILLLGTLCLGACGGGGGTPAMPPPDGDPDPDPDPDPGEPDETTRALLQACLPSALADSLAFAQVLDELLAGDAVTAGFNILPGSLFSTETSLDMIIQYDPDGDLQPEAEGALRFLADDGEATNPFDQTQIDMLSASGVAAFATLLPTLPDGSQVAYDFSGPGSPSVGQVTWVFQSGVAATSSGSLVSIDIPCAVTIDWEAQSWTGLLGAFPTATLGLALNDDTDLLEGTLVGDGTATALVDVSRNDGAVTLWNFDLQTGLATPR